MRQDVQIRQADRPREELDTLEGGFAGLRGTTEAAPTGIRTEAPTETEPTRSAVTWAWCLRPRSPELLLVPVRAEKKRGRPMLDM